MSTLHPVLLPSGNERRVFRADTILTMNPGDSLVEDGLVVIENDRIQAVGPRSTLQPDPGEEIIDLGDAVVAPGLINAHCHLELSHLKGRVCAGPDFECWVRELIEQPLNTVSREDLDAAVSELIMHGTAYVADILGHAPKTVAQVLKESTIGRRLFVEFFGFKPMRGGQLNWPNGVRSGAPKEYAAAGHALYSTHPTTLQMAKSWSTDKRRPFSMHLAEHAGEVEFLATGRGTFAELIKKRLVPNEFIPPGISPVEYADRLGLLDSDTLAVHCVHLQKGDIRILASRQVNVCLCPRSNDYIGVGQAPWEALFTAGVNLCLGTDSLASNTDLDLLNEAVYLARHWERDLSVRELLTTMTTNPARALGIEGFYGTLEPGKVARFSQVPQTLLELCNCI